MKCFEVKTKRLVLRQLNLKDYEQWYDYVINRKPQYSWDLKPLAKKMCSKAKFRKLLQDRSNWMRQDKRYRFWIFEKKSQSLIGQIDFHIHERGHIDFCNFGYAILNQYWGHGYGREAAKEASSLGSRD